MPTTPAQVEEAFQKTGYGWILADSHKDRLLAAAARAIDEFIAAYKDRFDAVPEPFALLNENPIKAAAFFQSFAGPPHSLDVRLLIWHVLLGADIRAVRFSYLKGSATMIEVETETAYGKRATFTSTDLWDFRLFRHIGIVGLEEGPILDGYYALQRR